MTTNNSNQRLNDLLCELQTHNTDIGYAVEFCRAAVGKGTPLHSSALDDYMIERLAHMLLCQAEAKQQRLGAIIGEVAELADAKGLDWHGYRDRLPESVNIF